jgi:hypothetical protein
MFELPGYFLLKWLENAGAVLVKNSNSTLLKVMCVLGMSSILVHRS